MSEWRETTIGVLASEAGGFIKTGPFGSQLHAHEYTDDPTGIPVVMPKDMVGGRVARKAVSRVEEATARRLQTHRLTPGDVVLARRGDVGRYAFIEEDEDGWLCGTGSMRIHAPDTSIILPKFLRYAIASPEVAGWLAGQAVGATMPNLNEGIVADLPIRLPGIVLQRRISAVLAAFDELTEINERRIELLEDLARSLYREWFVRFRFRGHEDLELADSELGPIPSGWAVRHLGDACDRITDGAHASPRSTVLGKPMASVKDMTHLSLDLQTCRLISTADFDRLSQQDCRPLVGDVLVSKDGAKYLDKVFEVMVENDVVVLSSIALLRPGHPIRSSVLASMLKNADTKARLKRSVSGAAIPRVVLKDFAAFKIVLPPMGLQDQFDLTGGLLIRVAARLEELNRALASIRDLLLPRLVTGRLDICDLDLGAFVPNENPA